MDRHAAPPLLALDGVETFYGPLRALAGVSLTVGEGTITAILGNNGAGKSTLLSTVMGVLEGQPRQGSISFRGARIDGMATEKIVRAVDSEPLREQVELYEWFARFPVVSVEREGAGQTVRYYDLRFDLPGLGIDQRPYVFTVRLSPSGEILSTSLK